MPRQPVIVALLTAAAALGSSGSAAAESPPAPSCHPPRTGYLACLQVLYRHAADATAEQVRVTAVLLQRVARCPSASERRTVTLTRSGADELATARRTGTCRKGLVRWSVTFGAARTRDWNLRPGDSVDAAWTGTTAETSVTIIPPPSGS